jgi:GNAT superfamily N-acetyltransferase
MKAEARAYNHVSDYERVGRFLVRTYDTARSHVNWLQPRWEYMHHHPYIRRFDHTSIGVWEAAGEIVGVAHPEHSMGLAYFEIDPAHEDLKEEMLGYAEQHLKAKQERRGLLSVYINDRDTEFQRLVAARGYTKTQECEPMSIFSIPDRFPPIQLPAGFTLKSLADDNNLQKLHRLLWRGFGHGGEPPYDGIEERRFMQSAPNYRYDLNLVVEAPDGDFAAYCGMWYEPEHAISYVEPVATDPDYRRMGLAKAAVLDGIRRCGEMGAGVTFVGSDLPFYLALGFQVIYNRSRWLRNRE